MGQKSIPRGVCFSVKNNINYGGNFYKNDYSNLLKQHLFLPSNLIKLFEKKRCFIKDCFFLIDCSNLAITLYVSFFSIKKRLYTKNYFKGAKRIKNNRNFFLGKLFHLFLRFRYLSKIRIIFQNLHKIAVQQKKSFFHLPNSFLEKELKLFKNEIYYKSSLSIFSLINSSYGSSILLAKFIAKYFKNFHKAKRKINKFLKFLSVLLHSFSLLQRQNKNLIKGLKIQIKGRFKGNPRAGKKIFQKGTVPLQTVLNKIDFSLLHVNCKYGVFSLKIWLFENMENEILHSTTVENIKQQLKDLKRRSKKNYFY